RVVVGVDGRGGRVRDGVDAAQVGTLAVEVREPAVRPARKRRVGKRGGQPPARELDPLPAGRGLAGPENEKPRDWSALRRERVQLCLRRIPEEERELERNAEGVRVVDRPRELVPPAVLAEAEIRPQVIEPER